MIYNERLAEDYNNILRYINDFAAHLGFQEVQIDTAALTKTCTDIRREFPHADGLDRASAFKKVANFVTYFLCYKPIKTNIPVIPGAKKEKADINAVVAFDIAIICLEGSKIDGSDQPKVVSEPIYISDHSYKDIIEALSTSEVSPRTHYQLLAVFFEQIVYKTNSHCEYPPEPDCPSYYEQPFSATDGDDMAGA